MRKDRKFWDRWASRYYKKPIDDMKSYEHKLKKTQSYLKADMELLEIGCGTGGTALIHAPFVKHIRAIDISPNMLKIAKSRPEFKGIDNVTFECTAIDELQLESESLDAVLAMSILHLLKDPEHITEEIYKSLKPGGIFVSSTVCIADFMPLMKWIAPLAYKCGLLPLINIFSAKKLESFMVNAGFTIDYQWAPNTKSKVMFIIAVKQ